MASAALALVAGTAPVAAQAPAPDPATAIVQATPADAAPLWTISALQVMSKHLDELQRRLDLVQLGPSFPWAYAFVDGVEEKEPGVVLAVGWAFGCGYDDARIVVVVDGIELANRVARVRRTDVNDLYGSTCVVPALTGFSALIDMTAFEPGTGGNHRHTFSVRVYPPTSASIIYPPFAMVESAVWNFRIASPAPTAGRQE